MGLKCLLNGLPLPIVGIVSFLNFFFFSLDGMSYRVRKQNSNDNRSFCRTSHQHFAILGVSVLL